MDILQDRGYKSFDYISRYSNFKQYYNLKTNKYNCETVKYLSKDIPTGVYITKEGDTYDSIALEFYNNPTLFWVICSYNRIIDVFEKPEKGTTLRIPVLSEITYDEEE